jgi:hypothetical protein
VDLNHLPLPYRGSALAIRATAAWRDYFTSVPCDEAVMVGLGPTTFSLTGSRATIAPHHIIKRLAGWGSPRLCRNRLLSQLSYSL